MLEAWGIVGPMMAAKTNKTKCSLRPYSSDRRAEIVTLLRQHGPLSVAALADRLPISAAGIRAHLRVLEAWGIVQTRLETVEERDARRYRLPKAEQARMQRSPRQILYMVAPGVTP